MSKTRYLIAILSLFFCSNCLFAQTVPAWGGGADLNDLAFGFSFSYVSNYYKIDKNADWRTAFIDKDGTPVKGPLRSISSANSPGFGVGFLTRYRITDHLEARITPSLIFGDRGLSYVYDDPSQNIDKTVQATMIDVPLSLKIKSDRLGNFRGYMFGGLKYSKSLSSKINADANFAPEDKLVKNIGGYASYEVGLGCDIYFEYFKLSPELKLSNSFGDVMLHDNSAFSSPINKLSLHTVMFSLIFE